MEPDQFKIDEGDSALRQIRERLGLSQEEFAQRLGTSWVTISRWERGTSNAPKLTIPQVKKLVRILSELDLTIEDLPDHFGPRENTH
jgi:putative transcriptional regulator